ncbi:hypothetical protein LEP1GSC109_4467, partial [Leptospira interrogans str. UI 13372]
MAPLLGLKNRGLDARFAFTTKQENRQKERNERKVYV